MQPYQEVTKETLRKKKAPYETAKNAVIAGVSFAGGVGLSRIASRITPFLSPYIAPELAKKGISKIDKGLGKFIDKSEQAGYDFDEIKDFIGQKISGEEPKQPEQKKNVIEQYSPELHQFLSEEIKKGRHPLEAGVLAQHDQKFSGAINKILKDHKTDWQTILQTVYGDQGEPTNYKAQQQQAAQQQQQAAQQPQQQMQGQQQGQPSQGIQALMQSIQELKKLRGG